MTRTFVFIAMQILLLQSCADKKTEEVSAEIEKPAENQATALSSGCYMMVVGRDTAAMNLEVNGNKVSGKLLYKNFEKDSNNGTLSGIINADTLQGWYHFSSEGTISVRQMVFRITKNGLAEGYGDVIQRNDSAVYEFPTTLNFESNHPFKPSDCSFFNKNFKD